jgi:hypothetical protein
LPSGRQPQHGRVGHQHLPACQVIAGIDAQPADDVVGAARQFQNQRLQWLLQRRGIDQVTEQRGVAQRLRLAAVHGHHRPPRLAFDAYFEPLDTAAGVAAQGEEWQRQQRLLLRARRPAAAGRHAARARRRH